MESMIVVNPSRHPAHPDQVRAIQGYFGENAEVTEPLNIRLDSAEDLVPHVKGKAWIFGSVPGPVAFQLGVLAGRGDLDDTYMVTFQEDRGARSRYRYAPDRMIVYRGAAEVDRVSITPTVEVDPRTNEHYPYEGAAA